MVVFQMMLTCSRRSEGADMKSRHNQDGRQSSGVVFRDVLGVVKGSSSDL